MKPGLLTRLDFVFSIILTAFGAAVLVESLRMTRMEGVDVNPYSLPGIVPGFLGALLALCGLILFVRSVAAGGWRLGLSRRAFADFLGSPATRRMAVTLVLTLVYAIVLFVWTPFQIGTGLFVFAFIVTTEAMALGRRPSWRAIASALVLAVICGVAVSYIFETLFYVRLPG